MRNLDLFRMNLQLKGDGKILRFLLSFAFVVGVGVSIAAITPCLKPSANTEYCRDLQANQYGDCSEVGNAQLCISNAVIDRKKFPVDSVKADAGVVTENSRDCWRRLDCVWDEDEDTCIIAGPQGRSWNPGDKIEEDITQSCPSC